MHFDSSQGRLKILRRTLKIGGILAIPVMIALGLGVTLGTGIQNPNDAQRLQEKAEQVKIQAQMTADQIEAEIHLLRSATGSTDISDATSLPESILLKAQLMRQSDGKYKAQWQAQNPSWVPGRYFSTESLMESALVHFTAGQASSQPEVSVLPMRGDSSERNPVNHPTHMKSAAQWLCFIFKKDEAGRNLLLVLVDPIRYFKAFSNWHLHGGNGKYRGFLVGTSGIVLAHSQTSLAASDLNAVPVLNGLLKNIMTGNQRAGSGTFAALDHQEVQLAAFRVGNLPLAVAVESPHFQMTTSHLRNTALFLGFFFLWGVLWYCASYLRTHLVEVRVHTLAAEVSDERGGVQVAATSQASRQFFTGMDFLILSESSSSSLTSTRPTVKREDDPS